MRGGLEATATEWAAALILATPVTVRALGWSVRVGAPVHVMDGDGVHRHRDAHGGEGGGLWDKTSAGRGGTSAVGHGRVLGVRHGVYPRGLKTVVGMAHERLAGRAVHRAVRGRTFRVRVVPMRQVRVRRIQAALLGEDTHVTDR